MDEIAGNSNDPTRDAERGQAGSRAEGRQAEGRRRRSSRARSSKQSAAGARSRRGDEAASAESGAARGLTRVVDALLAAIVFAAPLFMGGRHEVGKFVYVALVCALACAWLARQALAARARWVFTGAEAILALGGLALTAQILPLPPSVVAKLSPALASYLPLWQEGAGGALGPWRALSLTPAATQLNLTMYLAHAVLFLVVAQRVERRADLERLVRWIAWAAIGMAALALTQYFAGGPKYLWVYEYPHNAANSAAKGAFSNKNHCGHFLALGVGPAVWALARLLANARGGASAGFGARSTQGAKSGKAAGPAPETMRLVYALGLGLLVLAGLFTFSRGGIAVMLLAGLIAVVGHAWIGLLSWRSAAFLGAGALLVAPALCLHGSDLLTQRLESISGVSLEETSEGRYVIWNADWNVFRHYPWFGVGVGAHAEAYHPFLSKSFGSEFTHAESSYVQILAEMGLAGVVPLGLFVACCAGWCLRALRQAERISDRALAVALTATLAVSATHAIGDFVWCIPACCSLAVIAAAGVCRLSQFTRAEALAAAARSRGEEPAASGFSITPWRPVWVTAGLLALLGSYWMTQQRWGPALAAPYWDQCEALSRSARGAVPKDLGQFEIYRHEFDTQNAESLDHALSKLQAVVERHPGHARARLWLARTYLQRFEAAQATSENPMPLAMIRETAYHGGFTSAAALDQWLTAALGANRRYLELAESEARQALRLCPLQGEAYLYLSNLAFLREHGTRTQSVYLRQAHKVRPRLGSVLFTLGGEAALAGDMPQALGHWKLLFHDSPEYRPQLIALTAGHLAVPAFIEAFAPDREGLRMLFEHHRGLGNAPGAAEAGKALLARLQADLRTTPASEAAPLWLQASKVYEHFGDAAQCVSCLRRAVAADPGNYTNRRALAVWLARQGEFADAAEHLQWCAQRNPTDTPVNNLLTFVVKQSIVTRQR